MSEVIKEREEVGEATTGTPCVTGSLPERPERIMLDPHGIYWGSKEIHTRLDRLESQMGEIKGMLEVLLDHVEPVDSEAIAARGTELRETMDSIDRKMGEFAQMVESA